MSDNTEILLVEKLIAESKFVEADQLLKDYLQKNQSDIKAALLLVHTSIKLENYIQAEMILRELTVINSAEIYSQLALVFSLQQKFEEADTNYKKAIQLNNESPEINYNYAVFLQKQKKYTEAERYYLKVLKLKPDFLNALYNLGNLARSNKDFKLAADYYTKVLKINKNYAPALYNLAVVQEYLNLNNEAINNYSDVLALNKKDFNSRYNRALLYLKTGNWDKGWLEYECRLTKDYYGFNKDIPVWQGENLNGKTLFVKWEQGFGDSIQFCRYFIFLKNKFEVKIIFECKDAIIPLFEEQFFVDELVPKESNKQVKSDYQIYLMSLPGVLNVTPDNILMSDKYFNVNDELDRIWKSRLNTNKFQIGILWEGNRNHDHDFYRSINLKDFLNIFNGLDVQLVSLNRKITTQDKKILEEKSALILQEDFINQAAIINNLDLIVTVDTYLVHLAGALNKKTFCLIGQFYDWRWLEENNKTPWYNNVELFRNRINGSWEDVFNQVNKSIKKILPKNELQVLDNSNYYDVLFKANKELLSGKIDKQNEILIKNVFDDVDKKFNQIKKSKCNFVESLNIIKNLIIDNEKIAVENEINRLLDVKLLAVEYLQLGQIVVMLVNKNLLFRVIYFAHKFYPENSNILSNYGQILTELGLIEKAKECFNKALQIDSNNYLTHYNFGNLYYETGEYKSATEHFIDSLKIKKDFIPALYNSLLIELKNENFGVVWQAMVLAEQLNNKKNRKLNIKRWQGEKLNKEKLFIYSDDGFGDIIQFSRYLRLLNNIDAEVIFESRKSLSGLLKNIKGIDNTVFINKKKEPEVDVDYQIPLLQLPYILNSNEIPEPDNSLLNFNSTNFDVDKNKLNIGICWKGAQTNINLANRDIDPFLLCAFLSGPDVQLYNLQFDEEASVLNKLKSKYNLMHQPEKIRGFEETAKFMNSLDLVVTTDTVTVHLSGSINKKTFLLLPYASDWRWFSDRTDTPWYKSVKLFRQPKMYDWINPLNKIKSEINQLIKNEKRN